MSNLDVEFLRRLSALEREVSRLAKPEIFPTGRLLIDTNGYISAAVQPLVSAYCSANVLNVTGDGTLYTVIFDAEITDRDGNYNAGTGVFTAPVTGYYLVLPRVLLYGLVVTHTTSYLQIASSNRSYYGDFKSIGIVMDVSGYADAQMSQIVDMDIGDQLYIAALVSGAAGKVVDLYGAASVYTSLGIYLLP